MEKLRKALEEREAERLEKAKYTKRTGSPGNYKYEYGSGKGRDKKKTEKPSSKPKGSKANEAALDNMGFSAKQADNLNRRGVKAKNVQNMMDNTENEDLSTIDGLYKHYMGNVSAAEAHAGREKYKRNMQKKKRYPGTANKKDKERSSKIKAYLENQSTSMIKETANDMEINIKKRSREDLIKLIAGDSGDMSVEGFRSVYGGN